MMEVVDGNGAQTSRPKIIKQMDQLWYRSSPLRISKQTRVTLVRRKSNIGLRAGERGQYDESEAGELHGGVCERQRQVAST